MQRKSNSPCVSGECLGGYIDGMLDGYTLRVVDEHLRECLDCRFELDKLTETKASLASLRAATPEAPPMFWAETYRKARLSVPQEAPVRTGSSPFRLWGVAVGTAGVAALLMVGIVTNSPVAPPVPAVAQDQVDVASFVSAHADYVAGKHLIDGSNNRIIRSDMASENAGYAVPTAIDPINPEASANALSD